MELAAAAVHSYFSIARTIQSTLYELEPAPIYGAAVKTPPCILHFMISILAEAASINILTLRMGQTARCNVKGVTAKEESTVHVCFMEHF